MAKDSASILRDNLIRLIAETGTTHRKLGEAAGVTESAVSSWVNGTRIPRPAQLDSIAKFFHCHPSELLVDESARPGIPVVLNAEERKLISSYSSLNDSQKELLRALLSAILKQDAE